MEDQYQKEFYRRLFETLNSHAVMSPEFAVNGSTKGSETIDFFLPRKKWGLELLRNRDFLEGHMEHFGPGGKYHNMINSEAMGTYIILNFTYSAPMKAHPGISPFPEL